MTGEEPQVKARTRYRVGQICDLLGICRNTLYSYERRGRIVLYSDCDGRRYATGAEITRCFRGLPTEADMKKIHQITHQL